MKSFINLALAAAAALACSSCGNKAASSDPISTTQGTAVMVCDASFQNIIAQEIDVFEFINPQASILPYYVNEKAAVDSLLDMHVRLGVIARELTPKESEYIRSHKYAVRQTKIAVDALALIVNPDNNVDILSVNEIREILQGKLTRWDEIQPSNLGEIKVVFDDMASSTVKYMRDSLLNGGDFGKNVFAQTNNNEVFEAVKNNKNAIGIIGVSWISADLKASKAMSAEHKARNLEVADTVASGFDSDIKVLKVRRDDNIEAFQPYQAYIFDGSYPLFRSIYIVSTAGTSTPAHGFYTFVTSYQGQKLILGTGVLPAVVRPQLVNVN